MNVTELLAFINTAIADGSITGETELKSRSGGYDDQFTSYVNIEEDPKTGARVLNVSADDY